jgi:hypothetical protein
MTESIKQPAASDLSAATCSLPKQFEGKFLGYGMGKIFIKTKATGDTPVLDVRGWGHLTGKGSLGMEDNEAAKVQDQFERWVIETLNAALENKENTRRSEA